MNKKKQNPWLEHLKETYVKNNKTLKQTMIDESGKNKNKKKVNFVEGDGIYQDSVNTINRLIGSKARKLEDGEFHAIDASFMGPGTIIDKYPDKKYATSRADEASRIHDLEYTDIMKKYVDDPKNRAKEIRKADYKVLGEYAKTFISNPVHSTIGLTGIGSKVLFENAFPKLSKNVEKEYYGSVSGSSLGKAHQLLISEMAKK